MDELRVSNSPCSPEEWERILRGVLLGEGDVEGIEAGAEVKEAKAITVTVRRRVAGINVSYPDPSTLCTQSKKTKTSQY